MKGTHVCLVVAMVVNIVTISASGSEIILKPVSASGVQGVDWNFGPGNRILLEHGGQTVTMEIRLDTWSSVPDVGVCFDNSQCSISAQDCANGGCFGNDGRMSLFQARVDASGFGGVLSPASVACTVNGDCGVHGGFGFCGAVCPNDNQCAGTCNQGTGTCDGCSAGAVIFLDESNPEYVFFGLPTLPGVDTSTPNFAMGATILIEAQSVPYGGVDKYGGTVVVDVPASAVGEFTIGFVDNPDQTTIVDTFTTLILPLDLTPAIITIVCQGNLDCDDTDACTTDVCELDGTCSNNPNFPAGFCCAPDTGNVIAIDDSNDCTQDICNADGTVDHPDLAAGEICGDPSNAECDNPDTCNGAGTCLTNLEPSGASCGDPSDSECNGADTCDGQGVCLTHIAPSGQACGDASDTDCTNPDTCDGVGSCLANNAADGAVCDDTQFCTLGEQCTGGLCGSGAPRDCSDGLSCTTDSCNDTLDVCEHVLQAGFCLIGNQCFADGEFDPANDCQACNIAMSTTAFSLRPAASLCDDGNACTGTGPPPGTGDDTCDGAGVCSGQVDPNCNDTCADAVPVFEGVNSGDNSTAGPLDDAEASCEPNSNNDVWFVFTATCNGSTLFSTTGSNLAPSNDTVLAIFATCGGVELACNDDGGPGLLSALSLSLTGGVQYFIRVAGFGNNVGDIQLNINTTNDCVIDGVCFAEGALNPVNDCEECVPALTNLGWSFSFKGTVCGDQSDTECDNPDACDGSGTCEVNFKPDNTPCSDDGNDCTVDVCLSGGCSHPPEPSGTTCGDPTDNECDNPDTCDGASLCLDNFEALGVACGDVGGDQCDNPDICNGSGGCDPNFVDFGTPCDDGDVCSDVDICLGDGVCAGTVAADAPLVEQRGTRRFQVTPLPSGEPGAVALLVTSPDFACFSKYIDLDGTLTNTPVVQLIDDWGTVVVSGEDVVPSTTYVVVAQCGMFTSNPGSDMTKVWGDVDCNGVANLVDAQEIVFGFQDRPNALPDDFLDIWPCTPNGVVNLVDALLVVKAFQDQTYQEAGCPVPCP